MSEGSIESDMEIGVALAFGAVALVGTALLFGYPSQIGRAGGFAAAFVFALCAIVAVHVFD
ncbi:hypothetical protein U4E84_06800 [Halorubrum sp. AD140]|uniref:DUF7525 family protein n=1 Tax=Halorubrum sp. AD140 TaxID=3050073 RepID=UPI002ACCC06E|nr:hypothetical protein [Halorubrum sp. AD140]MDZ5811051.1 hypothetical protein [Halorubrum sp. AD140]